MQKTAEIFYDNGHQAIRLPASIHFAQEKVEVRKDEHTGDVILSEPAGMAEHPGDFETLFHMLDELGPAPEEFMLCLCDPLLEREARDLFGDEDDLL